MGEFDPTTGIEDAVAAEVQNGIGDQGIDILRDAVNAQLDNN